MVGKYQATLENKKTKIVIFHLESSGFGRSTDVLQNDNFVFNPGRAIDPRASEINGLLNVHGRLYLRGELLQSLPLRTVLRKFLGFLQRSDKPCTLLAHNCFAFDAPMLVGAFRKCHLEREFGDIVLNFVDTLPLFCSINLDRKTGQMKLSSLASYLPSLPTHQCDDALHNTYLLENLVHHFFSYEHLMTIARDFYQI